MKFSDDTSDKLNKRFIRLLPCHMVKIHDLVIHLKKLALNVLCRHSVSRRFPLETCTVHKSCFVTEAWVRRPGGWCQRGSWESPVVAPAAATPDQPESCGEPHSSPTGARRTEVQSRNWSKGKHSLNCDNSEPHHTVKHGRSHQRWESRQNIYSSQSKIPVKSFNSSRSKSSDSSNSSNKSKMQHYCRYWETKLARSFPEVCKK